MFKKIILSIMACSLIVGSVYAKTKVPAKDVTLDSSQFSGNLSSGDTDVQGAMETLDALTGLGGGLNDIVEDTTPQLGGNLDVNGQAITSVSNGDISITPNGTGKLLVDTDSLVVDSSTDKVGIGDTTPDAQLEVSNNGGTTTPLMISSDDSTNGDLLIIKSSGNIGIGSTNPGDDLELGKNKNILLSTDRETTIGEGSIKLRFLNEYAKAIIEYRDENDNPVIWLQAHKFLDTGLTNLHQHFSIEASDAAGLLQTRLGIGYGADNVDVTVNQADLKINRNTGMTNGNIVMTGGGGGGTIKHANDFTFYPHEATNATYALKLGLQGASSDQIFLSVNGSSDLHIGDNIVMDGSGDVLVDTGSIGVGDTTPDARLEVIEGGLGTPFMVSDNAGGDGDFMIVSSTGLVGIGTNSPTATLQVRGGVSSGNMLYLNPTATLSASESTGGAFRLTNTLNTGAGMVIYSNAGASTGRLFSVIADNTAFDQQPFNMRNDGTAIGAVFACRNDTTSNECVTISNYSETGPIDPDATALGVSGATTNHGVVKFTRFLSGNDPDGSVVSLVSDDPVAEDGHFIYGKSTHDPFAGDFLDFRTNDGADQKFFVDGDGSTKIAGTLGVGTTATASAMLDISKTSTNAVFMASSSGSGNGDYMIITSAGDVGIGSTNPSADLDVNGTIHAATDITIGSNSVCQEDGTNCPAGGGSGDVTDVGDCSGGACLDGTSDGGTQVTLYDAGGNTVIDAGGTSYFQGGNVGVGTTSPTESIETTGNVKAVNFIGSGEPLTDIKNTQVDGLYPFASNSKRFMTHNMGNAVGMAKFGTYEAACWYDQDGDLIMSERDTSSTMDWTSVDSGKDLTGNDGHDVCYVGIDSNGYIHVTYDMHSDPLNYMVSDSPYDISAFTDVDSFTGSHESLVTYSYFFRDADDVLYVCYRDGESSAGDVYLKVYDAGTTTWAGATGAGTDGLIIAGYAASAGGTQSSDISFYISYPYIDFTNNKAIFASVIRTTPALGSSEDIYFLGYDMDAGTFFKSDGTSQTMPAGGELSANPGDKIYDIPETYDAYEQNARGQIVQTSDGNYHVIITKNDGTGTSNYFQIYYGERTTSWQTMKQLTYTPTPQIDSGYEQQLNVGGIFVDDSDSLYILFADYALNDNINMLESDDGGDTWYTYTILEGVPNWRLNLNWNKWYSDKVFDMFIYWLPDSDQGYTTSEMPLFLFHWDPKTGGRMPVNGRRGMYSSLQLYLNSVKREVIINAGTYIKLIGGTSGNGGIILDDDSIGPDEVKASGQTDEYCLTYEATGDTWEWQACGGSSVWTDSGTSIYPTTSYTDNVGIGTNSPNAQLHVGSGNPSSIDGTDDVFIAGDVEVGGTIYGDGSQLQNLPGGGDVTGVGDCASGACLDGSSDGGTYVRLYDGDSNYTQIGSADRASDQIINLGTMTDGKYCTFTSSGTLLECNSTVSGGSSKWAYDIEVDSMKISGADITTPAFIDNGQRPTRMLFDDTTVMSAEKQFFVGNNYADGDVKVTFSFSMDNTQSGDTNVELRGKFCCVSPDDAEDMNTDCFASAQSCTKALATNQTADYSKSCSVTFTKAQADAMSAGDTCRFYVDRNTSTTGDATGYLQLNTIRLEEQ